MLRPRIAVLPPFLLIAACILSACLPQNASPAPEANVQIPACPTCPPPPASPSPAPVSQEPVSLSPEPSPVSSSTPNPTLTPTPFPTPTRVPCSPATTGPLAGVDPRGQRLTWWHGYSGERDLYAIVFHFNYSNACEIQVDLKYQGSYAAIHGKMVSALAKGSPPDLVIGYQNDQAVYQKTNGLVDLEPYVQDLTWGLIPEDQTDFYPSFWNQSVHPAYVNQRLGFALNRSMEVMFYNTTWARELGFDRPPATPAEFEAQACAAASANGIGGYILRNNASALAAWTFAFGGDVLDESGTRYVFNSPATIEAMTMLKRMADNRCAYNLKGYPNTAFAARRALFTQGSSSGLPFYLEDLERAGKGDTFDIIALPHTTAQPRQNVYGGDIMIPATSPERQLAAWIFLKWFTTPEIQALWVKVSTYYPTRLSTVDRLQNYQAKNPVWTAGYELLPFAVYEPQLISYDSVRVLAQKTFDRIILGDGTNIKTLLDELTERANQMQSDMAE
jgi:multiple sugar transport system substrate-binding protein